MRCWRVLSLVALSWDGISAPCLLKHGFQFRSSSQALSAAALWIAPFGRRVMHASVGGWGLLRVFGYLCMLLLAVEPKGRRPGQQHLRIPTVQPAFVPRRQAARERTSWWDACRFNHKLRLCGAGVGCGIGGVRYIVLRDS